MAAAIQLTASQKISMARAVVRKKWPYIMSTMYGLIPRVYKKVPTMFVTKGMVLGYNPDYVDSQTMEVVASALVHECSHVIRGYFERVLMIPNDDRHLYMIAADLPINDDLKKSGWSMSPDWLYPETFDFPPGRTTEEYFELLKKMQQKTPQRISTIIEDGGSGGESGQKGKGKDQGDGHGHGKGIGRGGCRAPSQEAEDELDGEKNEDGNAIGRTPIEKKILIRRTLQDIKTHMEQKGRGSVPGSFGELVEMEQKFSRIPWRDRMLYLVREMTGPMISGGDDYSLRRPSKRSYVRGLIRPGLIDQILVPFFIIDTSGSMSAKQMTDAVNEMVAILVQLGIDEAWFCQVDAQVAEAPRRVNINDLSGQIEFKGRGGTDFRPGFVEAMKLSPRPDLIFYGTDGDGYAPRTPCPIPTIWGIVPHSHYTRRPAPWGMVVTITDDEDHPDDDEDQLLPPHVPPAGWDGEEEEGEDDSDALDLDDDE